MCYSLRAAALYRTANLRELLSIIISHIIKSVNQPNLTDGFTFFNEKSPASDGRIYNHFFHKISHYHNAYDIIKYISIA